MARTMNSISRLRVPSSASQSQSQSQSTSTNTSRTSTSVSSSNLSRQSSHNIPPKEDEGSNIRVITRCRGRNDREIKSKSAVVVDSNSESRQEISVKIGEDLSSTKTYSLDRVFGPEADQAMIFDEIISPIVDDLMKGMNCTVFAYGQTGTGKTFTMTGNEHIVNDTFAHDAGIIPRVLFRIFNALESRGDDFGINCSFIELYNEELRDLLDPGDGKKVRIYDDSVKKSVTVQGLTECDVGSAMSGLKTLQTGLDKRHVASTKMNDLSSRSHTIFTLNVNIDSGNGEDCIRSKINLVDLAGSENVGKSGAQNQRAKEAGLINQSLLALGRVINSLVENKSGHIPYRESKLTRLLQDSLGGRTKTCIIATISPALVNVEETLSTLEYASRAKNIKNKPQVNSMVSKKALLKDYANSMEKLRQDLVATRKKNGIFMDSENYKEMIADSESQKILVTDQQRKLDTIDGQLKAARDLVENTKQQLKKVNKDLVNETNGLTNSLLSLGIAEADLKKKRGEIRGISNYGADAIGKDLMDTMDQTINEVKDLSGRLKQKYEHEVKVKGVIEDSTSGVNNQLVTLKTTLEGFSSKQKDFSQRANETVKELSQNELVKIDQVCNHITTSLTELTSLNNGLKQQTTDSDSQMKTMVANVDHVRDEIKSKVREGLKSLSISASQICNQINQQVEQFQMDIQQPLEQEIHLMQKRLQAEHQRAEQSKKQLEELRKSMDANAAHAAKEYETQINQLRQQLVTEKKQNSNKRKDLLQKVSTLMQELEESDERIDNQLGNLTCPDFTSCSTDEFKQVNDMIETSSSMAESASTRTINLLTQVSNSTRDKTTAIGRATLQFETDTSQAIETQVESVEHNVQALDEFMDTVGSKNAQQGELIQQQVGKAFDFTLSMVKNIESSLIEMKTDISTINGDNNNINNEMVNTWQLFFNNSCQVMNAIKQHVNELENLLPSNNNSTNSKKRKLPEEEEEVDSRVPLNELPTENLPIQQQSNESEVEKVVNNNNSNSEIPALSRRLRSTKRIRR